jgi:two-component system nitrogen regulation response regulator NtrX
MAHDILIVDDESDIRMLINGILSDEGYSVREAGDSDAAMQAVRARRPSLVLLDIWLKNSALDGLELLEVMLHEQPAMPVVMISGHGTIEVAVSAIRLGAYDFIEKPFKADRLLLACVPGRPRSCWVSRRPSTSSARRSTRWRRPAAAS